MDSLCPNPYEQQLYSVFKTFDVDDEGALDRPAVLQLCDTLQLESRGAVLVDSLFERSAERVTFSQFRSGLLSVLGEPPAEQPAALSDDDSSGREVAPKFVFGSKKYGRRSRPQRVASDGGARLRGASESRLDSARAAPRLRSKRSASAMESREDSPPPDLDHDRPVDRERALQLCRGLCMSGVDRPLVDRVFQSSTDEISVGEFFDRLNASLSSSIAATLEGTGIEVGASGEVGVGTGEGGDVVSSDAVAEAWERAGVPRPRRLLAELGFARAVLHPHELERALDDELRALPAPSDLGLLLRAAFALARLRLESATRSLHAARAERDKLRDDLAAANRRARLLAQDVDDNHARLEAELQAGLRQLEARHAEAAREAAAELAAERERTAIARLQLDEETARRVDTEARLRCDTASLRDQIHELQEQAKALEATAAAAEREVARAEHEACAAARREVASSESARLSLSQTTACLDEQRAESQRLRDRVDELSAALEASARRAGADCVRAPSWREEVAMHAVPEGSTHSPNEIPESWPVTKERNLYLSQHVEKLKSIVDDQEIPDQMENKCPQCIIIHDSMVTLKKAVIDWSAEVLIVATYSGSLVVEAGSQTQPSLGEEVEELSTSSIVNSLQREVEELRAELERTEQYWAAKLDDERDILAEEQRAGDERLSELVAKIAEYERQFARPEALPTIDESEALERQVTELELEFGAYRADKEMQLAARAEEVQQLQQRLEQAERRRAQSSAGERRTATCACGETGETGEAREAAGEAWARWRAAWGAREAAALRARAARAERAAQRLHARLAAADLLVKDLYIENCRLAHHPRLP